MQPIRLYRSKNWRLRVISRWLTFYQDVAVLKWISNGQVRVVIRHRPLERTNIDLIEMMIPPLTRSHSLERLESNSKIIVFVDRIQSSVEWVSERASVLVWYVMILPLFSPTATLISLHELLADWDGQFCTTRCRLNRVALMIVAITMK